jgi:hypothetical protein
MLTGGRGTVNGLGSVYDSDYMAEVMSASWECTGVDSTGAMVSNSGTVNLGSSPFKIWDEIKCPTNGTTDTMPHSQNPSSKTKVFSLTLPAGSQISYGKAGMVCHYKVDVAAATGVSANPKSECKNGPAGGYGSDAWYRGTAHIEVTWND